MKIFEMYNSIVNVYEDMFTDNEKQKILFSLVKKIGRCFYDESDYVQYGINADNENRSLLQVTYYKDTKKVEAIINCGGSRRYNFETKEFNKIFQQF